MNESNEYVALEAAEREEDGLSESGKPEEVTGGQPAAPSETPASTRSPESGEIDYPTDHPLAEIWNGRDAGDVDEAGAFETQSIRDGRRVTTEPLLSGEQGLHVLQTIQEVSFDSSHPETETADRGKGAAAHELALESAGPPGTTYQEVHNPAPFPAPKQPSEQGADIGLLGIIGTALVVKKMFGGKEADDE